MFDFWKNNSIFFFEKQKANSLIFCVKISSYRRIWPKHRWNGAKWTQEMVYNTYHHAKSCLDEKIEIDKKNPKIIFSLPISLRITLKLSLRKFFSSIVFYRKSAFNIEISSKQFSWLKKQWKIDPEKRSYDFLTKIHEKIPYRISLHKKVWLF